MSEVTLVDAINLALTHALEEEPDVILLGEDIGRNGGVFRATAGLLDRFGEDRVRDTPLAESMIAGVSVGMATQGLRPVCEIQFMGFIYPAIDQLVCHASRLRNRTRGRLSCPMVLRAPYGAGIHAPEHHSESTEAMLAHVPGLRVVIPSSPSRAYGLLLAAIRDPDPVVFLEPKRIYCQRRRQNRPRGGAKVGQWRGTKRHGACAPQIVGMCHGALARRANSVRCDQVAARAFRARLWLRR